MTRLRILAQPAVEPVSLDAALHHLRIEHDEDDLFVSTLISAARAWAEHFTGLTLAQRLYEWRLDAFADLLVLPRAPVQAIDTVIYYDAEDAEQTLDPAVYAFDADPLLPAIRRVPAQTWPAVSTTVTDPVRIRFVAGYDLPGTDAPAHPFPESIQVAILLMVGHLYEHREDVSEVSLEAIPTGARSLLRPYRVLLGMA